MQYIDLCFDILFHDVLLEVSRSEGELQLVFGVSAAESLQGYIIINWWSILCLDFSFAAYT